ncbi:glycosyltransferase family 39 protein [candidate division WOR-3 bacterium]|nr:glycosyltransferase family 39 protein [candidate division WOR-3 bacterium]
MDNKIEHFIEAHFVGLFGLLMFLFYLIVNLLPKFVQRLAKYDLPLIDAIFIVLGTGLVIYDFIPKQVDYIASRFRYRLIQVTDRLTPKSTLLIIFALTAIGFYLRFNNLGDKAFSFDEAITSYAAIGLLEHGTPVLPSGVGYNRAFLNSYLIALSFKTFGISEFSARFVSVIFGTLSIPLVYLMGKELGKRTGLIAALIITFSAFEIFFAQEARMYAQFQFFYLLTAYLFYISLKKDNSKLFLLSVVPFIFAWYSHVLSLCFIPVAAACILLYKRREFLKNKYFIYAILGITGLAFVYMMVTGKTPLDYMPHLTGVPVRLQHTCLHYVFADVLSTLFILVSISSTISIILWKFEIYRDRTYLYFTLNFFIPFIFLSLYPWTRNRYAFFIFPFLVILASHAIDFYALRNGLNYVCEKVLSKLKLSGELLTNMKNVIIIILILLLFIQVSSDIYLNSQENFANKLGTHDDWKKAGGFVKEHLDEDDKVATTAPLIALYYVGRVDYRICQYDCGNYTSSDGAAVDWYTGVIILDNYDLFMQKVRTEKGWLIADQYRLGYHFPDPKVRDYIRNNMTYYPEGSDETIEVYSWGNVCSRR